MEETTRRWSEINKLPELNPASAFETYTTQLNSLNRSADISTTIANIERATTMSRHLQEAIGFTGHAASDTFAIPPGVKTLSETLSLPELGSVPDVEGPFAKLSKQIADDEERRRQFLPNLMSNMRFSVRLPKLTLPKFPDSRSLKQLEQMSDEEIRDFLGGNVHVNTVQMALHVLTTRKLAKLTRPHWSMTPMFWLVVASMIVGVIGVLLQLLSLSR